MIKILHGDHEVKIHEALVKLMERARASGVSITRLNAKNLDLAKLETALGTETLFSVGKLIIIDDLLTLPKSKKKESLISWIENHVSDSIQLVLVEKKTLTALAQKQFSKAECLLFKYPNQLFIWLESLGGILPARNFTLFHAVLEREAPELIFVMLVRQIRILIAFVADGVYEGNPYLRSKIVAQAKHFSLNKLLSIHARLLEIDIEQKTSASALTLVQNLDLLLAQV